MSWQQAQRRRRSSARATSQWTKRGRGRAAGADGDEAGVEKGARPTARRRAPGTLLRRPLIPQPKKKRPRKVKRRLKHHMKMKVTEARLTKTTVAKARRRANGRGLWNRRSIAPALTMSRMNRLSQKVCLM